MLLLLLHHYFVLRFLLLGNSAVLVQATAAPGASQLKMLPCEQVLTNQRRVLSLLTNQKPGECSRQQTQGTGSDQESGQWPESEFLMTIVMVM